MTPPNRTSAPIVLAAMLAAGTAAAQHRGMDGPPPRGGVIEFEAIDTDGDGRLVRAELVTRGTEGLSAADTNGDGALDRQEIVLAMPGPHGPFVHLFSADPSSDRADRLLADMGATEAGRVEVAALAAQRVNDLLVRVDTDRDAAISQEEADAFAAHWRGRMERHHRGPGRGDDGEGGED